VLVVLLIGLSEIALWAMALRRLPSTLHPVFPQPISLPRTVKLITWALLGLALIGVASIPLGRAPQAPRLLSLAGGAGVGSSGSRASWSPDGRRLAVGGTNLPARVYDPATGAVLFDTRARAQYDVHDLAWSPDGARLLSAGTGIFIDDGRTGAEIACIAACPGPSMWTEGLAWSPDGHTLALAANRLHLFDTRSMTYTQVIEGANASRVAYSPDGSMIATAAEREAAHVWTSSGQLLNEFAIADGTQVRAIAWSPDGKRLAIAADYNVVEIWDVASGERVQALLLTTTFDRWLGQRPHHNPRDLSTAVAWSPDGRFLAAGSSDASAGVWELASGDQVLRLNGQTDFIGDIEFSPDGRRIATASQDRTVWVWDSSSIYE
jgi:WD40 repeat protein